MTSQTFDADLEKNEWGHEQRFRFSSSLQLWTIMVLLALFLYGVLFSTYPPVHDVFHEIRHSLGFIACH